MKAEMIELGKALIEAFMPYIIFLVCLLFVGIVIRVGVFIIEMFE